MKIFNHRLPRTRFFAFAALVLAGGGMSPAASAAGTSQTWALASEAPPPSSFRVVKFVDLEPSTNLAILAAGKASGLLPGALLKTYRTAHATPDGKSDTIMIETGTLKVLDVQDEVTVANIENQGTAMSKAFFPKFPGLMAGDAAVPQKLSIVRRQMVMPMITLNYHDIFEDPKAAPETFELTPAGQTQIAAAAQAYANARVSMLMVEGYTDFNGDAAANQIESYQRALTVRQYLIDHLGFDEKRVVAIGYGEAEPADPSYSPGHADVNRRIVLKSVAVPGGT